MELTIASNWDPELVEQLEPFPRIGEIFGVMQKTPVGSGRPYFIIANPSEEEAAAAIRQIHATGRKFNYLLNGSCMNNMEYDKETHGQLLTHLDWLNRIGVDSVTVTIPYLLEIIKTRYPQMEARVSVIAHVNSVQRARFFEALGADAITLDFNINRDLHLLEKIRKAVKCRLILIANDPCLYHCPFRHYHYNLLAHSTQPYNPLQGFYIDYCIVRCTIEKFSNPTEIIRSRWIRPEDTGIYEDIGIDAFKISGRRMSTRWLVNAARAYSEKRYDGNLFDILNCVTPGVDPDIRSPQYQVFLENTEFLNREKLIRLGQLYPVKPYVDNNALQGFLEYFQDKNCQAECECGYCERIAKQVIRLDLAEAERYISALKELLNDLTTSRIFTGPTEAERKKSPGELAWQDETREIFEKVIANTPGMFREIAEKMVKGSAEQKAAARHSQQVEEEDMVQAFLTETPAVFREQMLADLKTRGIDINKYLNHQEVDLAINN